MPPAEVTTVDELHNRLAIRIAAVISERLRESTPEFVCNLVFDRLSDVLMKEGDDTLLSVLDDLMKNTNPTHIGAVHG